MSRTLIRHIQGDDLHLSIALREGGASVDVAGAAIRLTIKRSERDVVASFEAAAQIDDAANGEASVHVAGGDLQLAPGVYVYDLAVDDLLSRSLATYTLVRGSFVVEPQVGR